MKDNRRIPCVDDIVKFKKTMKKNKKIPNELRFFGKSLDQKACVNMVGSWEWKRQEAIYNLPRSKPQKFENLRKEQLSKTKSFLRPKQNLPTYYFFDFFLIEILFDSPNCSWSSIIELVNKTQPLLQSEIPLSLYLTIQY